MILRAGVIGNPIKHSLSPQIFEYFGKQKKIEVHYHKIQCAPEAFETTVESCMSENWQGLNVTIPYKLKAAELASDMGALEKAIGACNVLGLANGKITGYNTDVIGFRFLLDHTGVGQAGQNFCLLGAGGVARAAAFGIAKTAPQSLVIFNRTLQKAQSLCLDLSRSFPNLSCSAQELKEDRLKTTLSTAPIWINTIPKLSLDVELKESYFFDLNYGSQLGSFFDKTQCVAHLAQDGLAMLIDQAIESWNIWMPDAKITSHERIQYHDALNTILRGDL